MSSVIMIVIVFMDFMLLCCKNDVLFGPIKIYINCSLYFVSAVSGGGPSSVTVSEETAVSLVVSWIPPNAHVLQYRVSYTALSGAETQDSTVSGLQRSPLRPAGQEIIEHLGVTENSKILQFSLQMDVLLESLTLKLGLLSTGVSPRW